jgi:hypothetical protein
MKRNKVVYSLFALILILIPVLTSCMPPASTPAAPAATPLTAVQERLVKVEQDITRKADVGQFQALESRMIKVESAPAATATGGYAKAETYSKAEVDAAVKTAVDSLKANQTWITAQTSPTPQSPYGVPTTPVTPVAGGQVTMITNPVQLPQIFTGVGGIQCTGTNFNVTPTGYVQPYTMRITNGSTSIQYVKPVITLSMSNTGGYYYGGAYPQLVYFNISISSGYGMVQGTGTSNFCSVAAAVAPCTAGTCSASCTTPFSGFCPVGTGGTSNGWFVTSQSNPSGSFPINLSPSNANIQPTPSFSFTPVAPSLNGYGEFMMTPGQIIDVMVQLQVGTLSQATLQISNTISSRL